MGLAMAKSRRTAASTNQVHQMHWICQAILFALVAFAANDPSMMTLVVVVTAAYGLFAPTEEFLHLILGLSIFDGVFVFVRFNAIAIMMVILLMKLMYKNHAMIATKREYLVAALIVLCLELATDMMSRNSIGEILMLVVYLLFFWYVLFNIKNLKLDAFWLIASFATAYTAAILYVFNHAYGGIMAYIVNFMTSAAVIRFANTESVAVGGAMGMPIYSLLLMSMAMVLLVSSKKMSRVRRLILICIVVFSIIFGLLTVSRSFVLGAGVFWMLFLLSEKPKSTKYILPLVLIAGVAFVAAFPELTARIYENFFTRVSGDVGGGSGRLVVWGQCLVYLVTHPFSFLFGCGALGYVNVQTGGAGTNIIDISAGAHNLVVDMIMSWGFVGTFFMCLIIVWMLIEIRQYFKAKKLIYYLPMLTYLTFAMTALRTSGVRTWIFMLMVMLIIAAYAKEKMHDT